MEPTTITPSVRTNLYRNQYDPGSCCGHTVSCNLGDIQVDQRGCSAICAKQPVCGKPRADICPLLAAGAQPVGYFENYAHLYSNNHQFCPYSTSDFTTESDISNYRNKFGDDLAYENSLMPYYCNRNDGYLASLALILGEVGDNVSKPECRAYCSGRWNTHPPCVQALQAFCQQNDNALNNDFCYDHCRNPDSDGRPQWCDSRMTSVCALTQPQASDETFAGIRIPVLAAAAAVSRLDRARELAAVPGT